jgi:hypothetical protein
LRPELFNALFAEVAGFQQTAVEIDFSDEFDRNEKQSERYQRNLQIFGNDNLADGFGTIVVE